MRWPEGHRPAPGKRCTFLLYSCMAVQCQQAEALESLATFKLWTYVSGGSFGQGLIQCMDLL